MKGEVAVIDARIMRRSFAVMVLLWTIALVLIPVIGWWSLLLVGVVALIGAAVVKRFAR